MEELTINDLVSINGGCPTCEVSDNEHVQIGYSLGYHVGLVIGETISEVGAIIRAISPFSWFK